MISSQNNNQIEKVRHSLAHIMALAVQQLYPEVKFGIGPVIEDGFYYDFQFKEPFSQDDLPKIEQRMKEIIKKEIEFKKEIVSKKEAKQIFKDQPYKLELIEKLPEENPLSIYKSGGFIDLCKGPHIKSTKEINPSAFKLTKVAGAYWQGDEKNPMLTRIYGIAFETKEMLDNYLKIQEEAEKRDHRTLGQRLQLFLFDKEVGAGLPLWQPKGATLIKIIKDYLSEELKKEDYQWVVTPHIGNLKLWQTSGHWDLYRENIYSPIKIDEQEYLLKPMNCPFHVKIYQAKIRSYKDLPLKYAEFGTVYRYERSGTLHGLTRVRGFTQDDAHIWCTKEQILKEVRKLLEHGLRILRKFGFKEYNIYLSTRPEKFAGTHEDWEKATNALKTVLEELKLIYEVDPGGGVFYGPKIDIKIKDSLGRLWQCTTIQVDFNLPERFDINYINEQGKKERPIMIHRALLGSLERFIGVLLEHYGGALPLWLSPIQTVVIPVSEHNYEYAKKITSFLKDNNLRAQGLFDSQTVSKKIRESELQKIPYILVVGEKETKNKTLNVRSRDKGILGEMKQEQFLDLIKNESL